MQKNPKLNNSGIAGLEVLILSLLIVVILIALSAAAFEWYLFYIRLNQAGSALKSASERLQTELDNTSASGAKATFNANLEATLTEEIQSQFKEEAEIKNLSWHSTGICPMGTVRDDPLLHLVVAFPHQPSFLMERLTDSLGYSATAIKIHLDREIEIDQ
ncbi:hypothetical protein [Acidaminobacter hydrogenoformans]|uniref:Uncharacterized protein n=1 Tax=Acidaminobacter hydrogenoformans DSM 2784 TaxID=1120920 RepID=A0A1G5RRD6_9FIRM|nr:hypothetical protein [Acidaminobacter hydrogenoformans]SCZ76643.1 hypothetical protein SAMN03080599_00346 [Acidaminobacter hydrogenoformans DSM 2784]